ncbi:MAG: TonB-dependent receptor [Crocinitomicaceae bacterium]|nr:TonB-dependent receptor [Crocinitomicaceae bacterium]
MRKYFLFIVFITLTINLSAQIRQIKGFVYDALTNLPIEFCAVADHQSKNETVTDDKGAFSLSVNQNTQQITVYCTGYKIDTLKINEKQIVYFIYVQPLNINLEEIVVTGSNRATLINENPISISAISTKQIELTATNNLIDALVKNTPGLTAVKTGPNISKPFIHGLGYNRVLTLYDGIRQEGQQYGDEHGLEIDDYAIERAEIIKGPASLLYGSDAIAGVISLFPAIPSTTTENINGKLISEYHSNNGLIGTGLRVNYSKKGFIASIKGSYRLAKNYKNPIDGRVYLTNFNVANFSALLGYQSSKGYTHLNFTLFDNHQGIPDGSRDSLSRKFTKQVYEEGLDALSTRPIVSDKELNTYKLPDLAQHIQHYRLYLHSNYRLNRGGIDFLLGGQQNIRREYTHPTMPKQAGMYMQLNTLNYGLRYNAPTFSTIEIAVGLNGMIQQNRHKEATDFPIPNYNLYDGGVYYYTKWKYKKWSISGGVRYDIRYVSWDNFYVTTNSLTGMQQQADNSINSTLQFEQYQKLFQGISGSIGATFKATRYLSIKANIGRAYRSPNITEIGSNGLDPGAHIIYLGNRNFKPEFSLQEDVGFNFSFKGLTVELSLFNNTIQNYIYMSVVADSSNVPLIDAQGNKTYQYQQAKAHLFGSEMAFDLHPEKMKGFNWRSSLSFVYGSNKKTIYKGKGVEGEYLPLIPPLRIVSNMTYDINIPSKKVISLSPYFEVEFNGKQNRYLGLNDTENYTADYTLFNVGVNLLFNYSNNNTIQIVAQMNNVFNKAYQSHLNRLKYFEYYGQSNNSYSGIYNMGRNIQVKFILSF